MDQLREMEVVVRVARSQSFTLAAKQLKVSRSTITKIVAALEERLGVRLLKRSTHHVSLTAAGDIYVREASEIVERAERLRQSIGQEQTSLSGQIRLGAPPSFAAAHLVGALLEFQRGNPNVQFDLESDDGSVNLIREGGISRSGSLPISKTRVWWRSSSSTFRKLSSPRRTTSTGMDTPDAPKT